MVLILLHSPIYHEYSEGNLELSAFTSGTKAQKTSSITFNKTPKQKIPK